jgi:hypothetical protein
MALPNLQTLREFVEVLQDLAQLPNDVFASVMGNVPDNDFVRKYTSLNQQERQTLADTALEYLAWHELAAMAANSQPMLLAVERWPEAVTRHAKQSIFYLRRRAWCDDLPVVQ